MCFEYEELAEYGEVIGKKLFIARRCILNELFCNELFLHVTFNSYL